MRTLQTLDCLNLCAAFGVEPVHILKILCFAAFTDGSPFSPVQGRVLFNKFSTTPDYSLRFKLNLASITSVWTSLLSFSGSNQDCCYGDRVPSIFVVPDTSTLHISQGNTQDWEFRCAYSTRSLELNMWHFIEVYAIGTTNKVVINGVLDQSCISGGARPRRDVVVYASSPLYSPAVALIADLLYEDLTGLMLYHFQLASRGAETESRFLPM